MAKFDDELVLKDSVSDKLEQISEKMSSVSNKGEKLKSVLGKMSGGLKTVGKSALSITGSLAKVGLAALGISATSVGALALSCSQAARNAETLNTHMKLLTGSAEKSKEVFDALDKEVGIFTRETLRGLSFQMLDSGIKTEKLIPTLKMLEGFSMGSADRLQKLTDELTKVSNTGIVTAQSLKALSSVGIDGQKEMQKQLGVTPKLFKKLLSAGRVTFEDYERLLTRVYNSNEKYNKSIEEISNTINGKFDIAKNKLSIVGQRLQESLGNIALPYLEKIADRMDKWADKLNNMPLEKVKELNEVLGAIGKLFDGIMWVIDKIIIGFKTLYNIAKSLVGVITGLFTDFKKFSDAFNSLSWTDILKGVAKGDLLDKVDAKIKEQNFEKPNKKDIPTGKGWITKVEKIKENDTPSYGGYAKSVEKIKEAQSNYAPVTNNNTNMTNNFSINGTVREEADLEKLANTITNELQRKYMNQGSY